MNVLARIWAVVFSILKLPKIEDEAGVKKLFKMFLDWASRCTVWIPGEADDEFVAMLGKIVDDPEAWSALYQFILQRFGAAPAAVGPSLLAKRLAEIPGIGFNYQKLLDFVKKLLDLISAFWG